MIAVNNWFVFECLCDASCVTIRHIHTHASHLGMLDEPHEGCDVEQNPKTVYGGPIPKVEGLDKC